MLFLVSSADSGNPFRTKLQGLLGSEVHNQPSLRYRADVDLEEAASPVGQ
jgi:hypothetical protein